MYQKIQKILEEDAEYVLNSVDLNGINGKTIIVTGASGLIGTHIVYSIKQYVEKTKANVKLILVCFRKLPPYFNFITKTTWIEVLQGDLTNTEFVSGIPKADIVIHCAGYASPGVFMGDKEKTLKINTATLFGLFEKLSDAKDGGKFLFMSSSSVYTDCTTRPYKVDVIGNSNTLHPRACYIEGKKCGETICNAYREKGIDAKSVRLSIIYGPGAKLGDIRALNTFIESAIVREEIQLLDDGRALKSYMYVSDAVELIWKMILFGKEPIYNLGGKSPISIAEIAQKVGDYLNVPVLLGKTLDDGVEGAILTEELDMTKTEAEFNKSTYVDIAEGLKRTIDWNIYNREQ